MLASIYGHTSIVQLLLEHGANVNLQNKVSVLLLSLSVCLTVVHLTCSTTIIPVLKKTFQKNALRCRDGYAKNHSNKMWMALCRQGKDGIKQEVKHT